MKKLIILLFIPLFLTCADFPILSELANDRIQLVLKGTYESNDPYDWNTSLYTDDLLATKPAPFSNIIPFSDVDMYLDIAEVRLAQGTGLPENTAPEEYWTYFTRKREVFCSDELTPAGYDLVSCRDNNGADNYSEFFSTGYTYPASDVPDGDYQHVAIYFRKFVVAPTYLYDASYSNPTALTTIFDNRVVNGTNLMDTLLQFDSTDINQEFPLLTPLERTDLNLQIPGGNDPFVVEVRIFIKNLLMNHYIQYGNYLNGLDTSDAPITFAGISDWKSDHQAAALSEAFQMGGQLIFTARVYDPQNVGTIQITDSEAFPSYKSYYAAIPSGEVFDNTKIPYAATKRVDNTGSTSGTITNLPPGNYDIYKTCDKFKLSASSVAIAGQDGYPESFTSACATVTVSAGITSNASITCICP